MPPKSDGVLQIFTGDGCRRRKAQVTQARTTASIRSGRPTDSASTTCRLRAAGRNLVRRRRRRSPQVVVENATRGAMSPDGRTLAFLRDEGAPTSSGRGALALDPDGAAPWSPEAVERRAPIRGVRRYSLHRRGAGVFAGRDAPRTVRSSRHSRGTVCGSSGSFG